MRRPKFSIIVAYTKNERGIGVNNALPWSIRADMKHFKEITTKKYEGYLGNSVIMGRKTWESLPDKYKPLRDRFNMVITSSSELCAKEKGTLSMLKERYVPSLNYGLFMSTSLTCSSALKNFVIGGAQIYKEAIMLDECEEIYVTEIDGLPSMNYDAFFPEIPGYFKKVEESVVPPTMGSPRLTYQKWVSCLDEKSDENQYLRLMYDILENGEKRDDRTGVGTRSLFGNQLRFSLADGTLPLLTTKKVFFRGVVEELLFFLRGDHDNRKLKTVGVHIWDGNTSREYLDKYNKQHIETDDLGLAYGVQWRAAGAKLEGIEADYRGKGVDQIQECIDLIRDDPMSRRILFSAWNVKDSKDMALVACHYSYQFYVSDVSGQKTLSCMMTMRSVDVFLGLPFNIASTGLLTILMARVTGCVPGEIVLNLGDTHIYESHIYQVREQAMRRACKFPKVRISKDIQTLSDIEGLMFKDFELIDYHSYPSIKAEMAV